MKNYQFVKNYRENPELRHHFNTLAQTTFGLDFSSWYENGYWEKDYIPYSFLDEGRVVANVSVYLMDLIVKGKAVKAVQIGTVMTEKAYQNQGLSRQLLEMVMADFENQCDFIYLFANESVLEFYPKFGFEKRNEKKYVFESTKRLEKKLNLEKVSLATHRSLLERLALTRVPSSSILSVVNNQSLLLFYFSVGLTDSLYYSEELDAIFMMEVEGEILHLYDIVADHPLELQRILPMLTHLVSHEIILYFAVKDVKSTFVEVNDDVLFVKGKQAVIDDLTLFPLTSHC